MLQRLFGCVRLHMVWKEGLYVWSCKGEGGVVCMVVVGSGRSRLAVVAAATKAGRPHDPGQR